MTIRITTLNFTLDWGHNRLLSFYKEIGGMSARPREQYWISTATESSVSGMNGILKEVQ